ncbi:MAG: glycolate oxidase subunit GlcE [Pseudomonadota bacterium]
MLTALEQGSAHRPTDEDAVCGVIREAAEAKSPLEIIGGGTRRGLGRPVQAAASLSTAALSGITLYEPGALTIVAKAGTPLGEVEAALAAEGQHLPFEPMDHRGLYGTGSAAPTIGGVVAAGVAGPRRLQAGGCRDSLIGVRFVNGKGEAVKSGGRVMKNVTGYDLVKLLAGSFGTLGVLTEVSFKVLPRPEMVGTLILQGLSDADGVAALCEAMGSPFDVTGAAHVPTDGLQSGDPAETVIRVEGFEESVRYRLGELQRRLARFGDSRIDTDQSTCGAKWSGIRDVTRFHEAGPDTAVWRLSVKPTDGPAVVAAIQAARPARCFYDWSGGLIWLATAEDDDAGSGLIRSEVAKVGGDATLVRASETLRAALPVFPPQSAPVTQLTESLRRQFDPSGILNPGRMG